MVSSSFVTAGSPARDLRASDVNRNRGVGYRLCQVSPRQCETPPAVALFRGSSARITSSDRRVGGSWVGLTGNGAVSTTRLLGIAAGQRCGCREAQSKVPASDPVGDSTGSHRGGHVKLKNVLA